MNWRLKLTDPSILSVVSGITHIRCEKRHGYFVFMEGHVIEIKPYKKCLKQFRIPNIMIPYMDKEMRMTRDFINSEPGELFRIEPIGFEIKNEVPYFTKTHFYIPPSYIHKYLDERAAVFKISLISNTIKTIQDGTLNIILTEQDTSLSSVINIHGKSLRSKISAGMHHVVEDIYDFEYESTTEKTTNYKYGIMIFRRNNGQNISTIC